MAVVNYSNQRSTARRAGISAPIEVMFLETSGQFGLFFLLHLVAGLALWTSLAAAFLLWTALNARSLQESDATLSQRFFGLRLDTPRQLPLCDVVAYSLVMSGFGVVAWVFDVLMSKVAKTSLSHQITGCEIELAAAPGLFQ